MSTFSHQSFLLRIFHRPTIGLGAVFYRSYFPSYINHLHRDSKLGQFFVVVAFVPIISLPKKKHIWLRSRSSIVLSFRATENIFIGTQTKKSSFFAAVAFVPVISSPKQTTLILVPFFYRARFPRYKIIFTETRTGNNFRSVLTF
jgi:hypothetical protein